MPVRALNPEGTLPPLLLTLTYPPLEGGFSARLAEALGRDQPVYVVSPPPIGDGIDLNDPQQWVAHYYSLITELPLRPPYSLLGYSFGGIIAMEVADLLRRDGHGLAYVGVVDTWLKRRRQTYVDRMLGLAAELHRLEPGTRARHLVGRAKSAVRSLLEAARGRRRHAETAAGSDDVLAAIICAWKAYTVHAIEFPISFYSCTVSAHRFGGDPTLGWGRYLLGGFEHSWIDGRHLTIFEPQNLDSAARAIRQSLMRRTVTGTPAPAPRTVDHGATASAPRHATE
jgi:thioesterase domain-containing protein